MNRIIVVFTVLLFAGAAPVHAQEDFFADMLDVDAPTGDAASDDAKQSTKPSGLAAFKNGGKNLKPGGASASTATDDAKAADDMAKTDETATATTEQKPQDTSDMTKQADTAAAGENQGATDGQDSTADAQQKIPEIRPAPFGLQWGMTVNEVELHGAKLKERDYSDQHGSTYDATNLPRPLKGFDTVRLSFGDDDRLFRIVALSDMIDDDTAGTKVLKKYNLYNDLLSKKYGTGEPYHQPGTMDFNSKVDYSKPANFLPALKNRKRAYFTVYENPILEMRISIHAVEETQAYLSLIYQDKVIINERKANMMEAL